MNSSDQWNVMLSLVQPVDVIPLTVAGDGMNAMQMITLYAKL